MANYQEIPLNKAYRLLNTGSIVLISTASQTGINNIAPIAWCIPAEMSPTRVLLAMDGNHKTFKNIQETNKFIVSIPHLNQAKLVRDIGSVSGEDVDKYKDFSIKHFSGNKVNIFIPEDVIGYIECKVFNIFDSDGTMLVIGEALYAAADPTAFQDRLLAEKPAGKTLYHLGGKKFITTGDNII